MSITVPWPVLFCAGCPSYMGKADVLVLCPHALPYGNGQPLAIVKVSGGRIVCLSGTLSQVVMFPLTCLGKINTDV